MTQRKERHTTLIDSLATVLFPFQESEEEQESFTDVGRQRVDGWIAEVLKSGEARLRAVEAQQAALIATWRAEAAGNRFGEPMGPDVFDKCADDLAALLPAAGGIPAPHPDWQDMDTAPFIGNPMSNWQSIETAPKDGTVVMLWSREFDHRFGGVHLAWYGHTSWMPYIPVEWTHWQPLPAPPVTGDPPPPQEETK